MTGNDLENRLRDKDNALSELAHRVKNDLHAILSMIGVRRTATRNAECVMLLNEMASQILVLSSIYSKLRPNSSEFPVEMDDFMGGLVKDLSNLWSHREGITVVNEVEGIVLPMRDAVSIGILANEAITNAVKHAFPHGLGTILVRLSAEADHHLLTISDDGVGIRETNTGLGRKIMESLARQLGGTMAISSMPGRTLISIAIPKN